MSRIYSSTDVIVVGAGPTGCTAALAFARRGARVMLIDAQPDASRRLAGEWMHPPAVRELRRLGVDTESLGSVAGYGFVLYGGDGGAPVQLPYVRGTGIARVHHELVQELRDYACREALVDYRPYHAFVALHGGVVELQNRRNGETLRVVADRVIGADGSRSKVLTAIGPSRGNSEAVSYMLGVELHDIELPHEGLGHVFFGGPGPALFYRVSPTLVRGCLDVPLAFGTLQKDKRRVIDAFRPFLPESIASKLDLALELATPWAATRFKPRACFGRGRVWLAGDAVGHVHPVSGMGMTFGVLDAVAAASAATLDDYQRSREVHTAELLTNLLYQVFGKHDPSTARVRNGLLEMLRRNPDERRRTMQILTSEDRAGSSFVRSFLHATGYAIGCSVRDTARRGDPREMFELAGALTQDAKWLRWPIGALLGEVDGVRRRRRNTRLDNPLPTLGSALDGGGGPIGRATRVARWLSGGGAS